MKKVLLVIGFIGLLFSLYIVSIKISDEVFSHNKKVTQNLNDANEMAAKIYANNYIKAINASITLELFNTDIVDGEYRVKDNQILNVDDENIFYEISYKGIVPESKSRIFLENNEVKKATLYVNNYKIEINNE